MIHYSVLLPFAVIFSCFVGMRLPLIVSTTIGLITALFLNFFLWQATPQIWNLSLIRTGETITEIGLILVGAFFFLEAAEETGILKSLAQLVREITHLRVFQGILVCFCLAMMVEGSSGFGTPFLIIIPLLASLNFPIYLCAVLPFMNVVNGIPFGALGTPLRLGFENYAQISTPVASLLVPFTLMTLFCSGSLILIKDPVAKTQSTPARIATYTLWVLSVAAIYIFVSNYSSRLGPEFPALAGGFAAFTLGIAMIRFITPAHQKSKIKNIKGLITYALLLAFLWIGKRTWMDETIPQTHIRIFNPGWVFLIFSFGILAYERGFNAQNWKPHELRALITRTFHRGKRTLWVLFCMTFIVQMVRNNGAIQSLTEVFPDFLQQHGTGFLGWMGTIAIGTSTVCNMLFSKMVDPGFSPGLAIGSAIGVQLAFQSLVATRGALKDKITEAELFRIIFPVSAASVIFLTMLQYLRSF